jgi:hypothetical protein
MDWVLIAALFLFIVLVGSGSVTRLVQPLFEIGPLKMDWRDIIALAVVIVVGIALYRETLTERDALKILAAILIGKLVGL